jgi:hypothetical protein
MRRPKFLLIALVAVIIAAFLLVGVTGFGLYHFVSAAINPTAVPGQTNSTNLMPQYWELFVKTFAENLGVNVTKLDSAFVTAINTTVDQAVQDGKITQSQADSIKSRYSQGLSGLNNGNGLPLLGIGRGFDRQGMNGWDYLTNSDIASALGISETDLNSDFQAGQSIADIAKAQNKDLSTVKQTLLADVKSRLDSDVSNDKLTQSQAEQIYQNLSNSIDTFLNSTRVKGLPGNFGFFGWNDQQLISLSDIASALGINETDLQTCRLVSPLQISPKPRTKTWTRSNKPCSMMPRPNWIVK